MAANFFDDPTCMAVMTEFNILIFGLLSMLYVGVNRLSVVPCICAFENGLAYFVGWYVYTPGSDGKTRENAGTNFLITLIYCTGDFTVVFYGYFLLERLLPRVRQGSRWILSRRTFLFVFWSLQSINGCCRVCVIVLSTLAQSKGPPKLQKQSAELQKVVYNVSQVMFLVVTVIEVLSAYLLIALFRRARKISITLLGGKRLGLLKHLLLSTEMRVASISLISIIRAGCELSKRNNISMNAVRIDATAIDFWAMLPMFLIADCIFRKTVGFEMELQNLKSRNGEGPPQALNPAQQLGILGSAHVPTVDEKGPAAVTATVERAESA